MSEKQQKPWGELQLAGWKRIWLKVGQSLPWRRLVLWWRVPLKRTLEGLVDTEIWGVRLRLLAKGNLSEQRMLFFPNLVDKQEREVLSESLKEGGRFLDIGANAGLYTLWIASRRLNGVSIEAFEPDSELRKRLSWNIEENQMTGVCLWDCALGTTEKEVGLLRGDVNLGENSISEGGDGIRVPMRRLDLICQTEDWQSITAMKIDVEGHEEGVLEPFFSNVPREKWPVVVICEDLTTGHPSPGARVLVKHGYVLSQRTRMNGVFRLE